MARTTAGQDVLTLIRLLLLEDSTVAFLVEDRITGPFAPRSGTEEGETIYPRIVIDVVGGGMDPQGALQTPIVQIYAYSRTSQGDAVRVYDAVRPVLRMARLQRDGVGVRGTIREAEVPVDGFNSQLGAWYSRGTYRVIATALGAP